jgi:superfamily II DNA or RNA helicase
MNIEVTRFDGGLKVKPFPHYLNKFLKYSHREMKVINYRRECVFVNKLLYIPDSDGGAYTLPGFFHSIVKLMQKNLDTPIVSDLRSKMPEPDWSYVKRIKLRDYQREPTLDLIFKGMEDSGVVNAAGGFGKTFIQAITYAAWHRLNTILTIPLKQVAIQTHKKFTELFPDKHIGFVGDGKHDVSTDITISTFKSLKSCALEKCELLLVDEMQSAGQDTFQSALQQMRPKRIFGYSATTEGIFNNTDKLLKGLFGEDLVYFPYEDAEAAGAVVPGVVYMIKLPDNLPSLAGVQTIENKLKKGIKQCVTRNELIGKVCSKIPDNWQAIVFIDHVKDHLIPLYKYMPKDVKFLHRESSKKNVGSFALSGKQQNEIIQEFSDNKFKTLIASDAFRAGVDIPNCRVVVQASGGSSKVEVLQEAYRGSRILTQEYMDRFNLPPKTHFVLVDFMDNHDPTLEGMAKKRIKYYEEQGWLVKTIDTVEQINWNHYEQTQRI